jgi:hypothetical protein
MRVMLLTEGMLGAAAFDVGCEARRMMPSDPAANPCSTRGQKVGVGWGKQWGLGGVGGAMGLNDCTDAQMLEVACAMRRALRQWSMLVVSPVTSLRRYVMQKMAVWMLCCAKFTEDYGQGDAWKAC